MLNILFMGTPDIARESLKLLYDYGYNIVGVVTNPDKPKGRGMKLNQSPVKEYALQKGLNIYQPEKVKKNVKFIEEMKSLKPDVICVVSYGKLLPKEILDIPIKGCINTHFSLLPKYRGAAPVQWAVLNGDEKTGVTTMYMDVGLDTGDIIYQKEVEIGEEETTGELFLRLTRIGADVLLKTIESIELEQTPRRKQSENYSLAPMLEKEMAKIDWENRSAKEIKNLVRGLNPIMGAYSFLNGKQIKFWKINVLSNEEIIERFPELKEYEYKLKQLSPGTVLFSGDKNGLYIKANEGIIEVLEIQGENAKKMDINDFLRGNKIDIGDIFE